MDDIKRLSRLTAILTILQTKRLFTASELASKFSVSNRTIYRDIKALEQAGIPILTEEGKGYSLMEGYSIPPVMFTESEANALITAEKSSKGDLMKGLVVNKWTEIWEMDLERTFTSDFEVFGEKAQNPADAEIDFLIAIQ